MVLLSHFSFKKSQKMGWALAFVIFRPEVPGMKINIAHLVLAFAVGVMAAGGVLIQNAQAANQPHMYSALDHLRAARHQLEVALDDKGGHRVKAIAIIDNAIGEVKDGIAAGN